MSIDIEVKNGVVECVADSVSTDYEHCQKCVFYEGCLVTCGKEYVKCMWGDKR